MSYNILKKNVRFSGDSAGTIEGMVDTSTNQSISGSKDFQYLTGSNVLITGELVVDDIVSHQGDSDTKIQFGTDSMFLAVGGTTVANLFDGGYVGGPKMQLTNNSNLFVASGGKVGIGTSVTVAPDHELVVTGTIGVAGQITCSLGITASEFHGDGSNLSGIEPTAANIVGTLSASQIDFNSPLQNNSERLDVSFASNRGIVDDSGVALDVGNLSSTTTYADTLVMPISGSGATGNRKMTFGVLEANMNFHLTNSVGTLPNARLPSSISVTNLTASSTGQFTNINASGYVSASLHVSASEFATAGGTVIDAEGNFQGNNATFHHITASGVVSASAEVSASSFHGDGSQLQNLPPPQLRYVYINGSNANSNDQFLSVLGVNGVTNVGTQHGGGFIAPGNGQLEFALITPTVTAAPASGSTVTFVLVKNEQATNWARPVCQVTGTFNISHTIKNDSGVSTACHRAKLDFRNGDPTITGSLSFSEGDQLLFGFKTSGGERVGITLAMTYTASV